MGGRAGKIARRKSHSSIEMLVFNMNTSVSGRFSAFFTRQTNALWCLYQSRNSSPCGVNRALSSSVPECLGGLEEKERNVGVHVAFPA